MVARELYDTAFPVVLAGEKDWSAITTARRLAISADDAWGEIAIAQRCRSERSSSLRRDMVSRLSALAKARVMPKGELPSRSEQEADECLHCAISHMVDERIAAGGADAADL